MFEKLKKSNAFLWVNEKISDFFFIFLKLKNFRNDPDGTLVIHPSQNFTPDLSNYNTTITAYWHQFTNFKLDPLFYVEIENATIVSKGIVVDAQKSVILESTIFQEEYLNNLVSNHYIKFSWLLPFKTEDKVFSLLNKLDNNYFHWTLESLTRLLLVYELPIFKDYKIAVKVDPLPFINASLSFLFNIPESRIIEKPLSKNIRAKKTLVVSFPHIRKEKTQWTNIYRPEIIRQLNALAHSRLNEVSIEIDRFPENIIISRKKTTARRIINEDELISFLGELQFTPFCLEDISFIQQVALFANAKIIIATHGAGITNIAYCKSATVVELFPSQRNIRDAYYFAQISAALKLPHHLLLYKALNKEEDAYLSESLLREIKAIVWPT